MVLPATVRRHIESYLDAADRALPGFVEGLYVTGSIPLGDYHPAVSDVDLVAVSAGRPTEQQLDVLSTFHGPSQPSIDVLYVTWADLGSGPHALSTAHSLEGTFRPSGGFDGYLVTWRQLQTAATAVRGPRLANGDVRFDAGALREWNMANLGGY